MRKHIPPQSLFFLVGEEIAHCPLTVPSGDTPCVTAGDARRVNPRRSGEVESGEKKETSQPAPTVPGGDTPCVTAGDARRVNPWRSGEVEREASDTGGVAQHPLLLNYKKLPLMFSTNLRGWRWLQFCFPNYREERKRNRNLLGVPLRQCKGDKTKCINIELG